MDRKLSGKKAFHGLITTLVGIVSLMSPGCSGMGYYLGDRKDTSNGEIHLEAVQDIMDLSGGDSVTVRTTENTVSNGIFLGYAQTSFTEYLESETEKFSAQEKNPFSLHVGDTLLLVLKTPSHAKVNGWFDGFTDGYLKVQTALLPADHGSRPFQEATEIPLDRVETLYDMKGRAWSGELLKAYVQEKVIPQTTFLAISVEGDTVRMPVEEIESVGRYAMDRPVAGRVTYAILGLAVDAAVVALIVIQSLNGMNFGGSVGM